MIDRLASKRVVILVVLMSASVILISGSREWASGTVGDGSLGAAVLHGKGSDIAPGALAAALVGLASAVAVATSGRVMRVIAACSAVLASVLGAGVVISVIADPGGALAGLAAAGTGRSGTAPAQGQVGTWAWVALTAMLVMGLGGVGALVGSRRWGGPSSRYDAPVAGGTSQPGSTVQMSRRPESEWDLLSRGEDPTAEQ
jgi:uncharacterized membrane protein (TIGR02234 family)